MNDISIIIIIKKKNKYSICLLQIHVSNLGKDAKYKLD